MRATFVSLGACALVVALLASGCGSQGVSVPVPTPEQAARRLGEAPPPLAALHREASRLLDGGEAAFRRRLAGLRGHPVVVNAWASWCGPCTEEFPLFQRAAVGYGTRVGFLGLDVDDAADEARTFLRDHWVAYPSYADPDERMARAIGVRTGLPTTVFYDRRGEVAFVHQGPYRDEAQLTADIERYLRPS
jgi:cytochrome c biogenesis protein CcmG/thiol:disulfide interchange protein DsbE